VAIVCLATVEQLNVVAGLHSDSVAKRVRLVQVLWHSLVVIAWSPSVLHEFDASFGES